MPYEFPVNELLNQEFAAAPTVAKAEGVTVSPALSASQEGILMFRGMAVLQSKIKGAPIWRDATTKEEVVSCPYCSNEQEPYNLGWNACENCDRVFDVYVPEVEA